MLHSPKVTHARLADAIRVPAADAAEPAGTGHPRKPMGMADVATVLFTRARTDDASRPDRDRFVLSAGHGPVLPDALLHLTGCPGRDTDSLKSLRQPGSAPARHPDCRHGAGMETTPGPLGQGLTAAVGMANGVPDAVPGPRDGARAGVKAALRPGRGGSPGEPGGFVGIEGFGTPAPAAAVCRPFGIAPGTAAGRARAQLSGRA
ncbi:MAG: hypothetical protein INF48_03695 [Rhodobacter sp.]|nr:hypothetical protein [Rhodobacter sp.]